MEKLRELNPLHDKYGYLSLVVFGAVVLAIGLLGRSDLFLSIVGFVLEILGWLGILGGAAIVAAGVAAFGHERGWWNRIIEANGQSGAKLPLIRGTLRIRALPTGNSLLSSCPGCPSAASARSWSPCPAPT